MRATHKDPLSFTCANSGALKARGVNGPRVSVRLDGEGLDFSGDDGGRVTIVAKSVDRIRQFHSPAGATAGFHETRIWWEGEKTPVVITERRGEGYRAAIAGFAEQVADLRGPERLEIGPGSTSAIINASIVLLPFIGVGGFMLWIAGQEGGWWWLGAPIVLIGLAWLVVRNLMPRWPRRAGTLDQFLARLPQE